jgi:hypothetical protein
MYAMHHTLYGNRPSKNMKFLLKVNNNMAAALDQYLAFKMMEISSRSFTIWYGDRS